MVSSVRSARENSSFASFGGLQLSGSGKTVCKLFPLKQNNVLNEIFEENKHFAI